VSKHARSVRLNAHGHIAHSCMHLIFEIEVKTYTHTNRHKYTYTHTHTDKHTPTETNTQTHTDKHTYTQTHPPRQIHIHTHAHRQTQRQTQTQRQSHTNHTHTDTQTHTRAHTHAHTHTHTHSHELCQDRLLQHLQDQWSDRRAYWALRDRARTQRDIICLITDGMDKSKFALPRWGFGRAPKDFEMGNLFRNTDNRCTILLSGAMILEVAVPWRLGPPLETQTSWGQPFTQGCANLKSVSKRPIWGYQSLVERSAPRKWCLDRLRCPRNRNTMGHKSR
jgi:hypothetical protein